MTATPSGRGSGSPAVKICGLCRPEDAALAVDAGATHIGVIRVPGSRRTRSLAEARLIVQAGSGARAVGVFLDAGPAEILEEAEALSLDVVQLHGRESPAVVDRVAAAGYEVWKVLKPGSEAELRAGLERYAAADLILVEGRSDRGPGGVGAAFPRDVVQAVLASLPAGVRVGLAGGLTPETVAEAVRALRPALVDVSSGVEREVGRKDAGRVRAFVRGARAGGTPGDEPSSVGTGE